MSLFGKFSQNVSEQLPDRLPAPDIKGNYWLGKDPTGPAILSSCIRRNEWFASLGNSGGVLFRGQFIQYFNTPEGALFALKLWARNNASQKG